jgi:chemotaxis signal transduction protein
MFTTGIDSFLICEVQGSLFALPLACVERVVRAVEVSALPHSSSALLGVINVQGHTVPVVNTYFYFDLPTREIDLEDFLILLSVHQQTFAVPANRVLEVVSAQALHNADVTHDEKEHDSASEIRYHCRATYASGIAKWCGSLICRFYFRHLTLVLRKLVACRLQ